MMFQLSSLDGLAKPTWEVSHGWCRAGSCLNIGPLDKKKCTYICVVFTDTKETGKCIGDNECYYTLYCKFHIAHWFSHNAFIDFCRTLVSPANLRLSLMNTSSSDMNTDGHFCLKLMNKNWNNKDACQNVTCWPMMWEASSFIIITESWSFYLFCHTGSLLLTTGLSSCSEWGALFVLVLGLLIVVASLVMEHWL